MQITKKGITTAIAFGFVLGATHSLFKSLFFALIWYICISIGLHVLKRYKLGKIVEEKIKEGDIKK